MRIKKQIIEIRHGSVLLCDPFEIGHDPSQSLTDGATFKLWEGGGNFKVFTDGNCYFIDVDPCILKANTRPQLTQIPGQVGIDSTHIGIYDLTPERIAAADDSIADGIAVVINDLPLGTYVTWFEEKGAAQELFRGVVGFGRDVTMLLNGDTGQQLQSIEVRIAAAYRLKGPDKQTEMESIGQLLSQIHLDGCKDPRLRMMADAIKLKLPRRSSRKR